MITKASRKPLQKPSWPRKVQLGRVTVSIYQRRTPSGGEGYIVANYSSGKRRFDSYAIEDEALEAAQRLCRQMSEGQVMAARLTDADAAEFAAARQKLEPFKVGLLSAADTMATCLGILPDVAALVAAAKFYATRNRTTTRKPVSEVVAELIAIKKARKSSTRYLEDLGSRLGKFADAFKKDACDVTTAQVQAWLDSLKCAPQTAKNYRTVLNLLFEFAVARGYAADNPIEGVESLKVRGGEVEIYTPEEIRCLLAAAAPEFLPCLALGAFAGLRSAEIERLLWEDVHLAERHIIIGKAQAKTASRRIVPICDALAAWLAPFASHVGLIWKGTHEGFYDAQQTTAASAGLKWRQNALRHSYASYRVAMIADAGRVASELGNSASIVHRHYKELVRPADAQRWFAVTPETAENIVPLQAAAV